MIPEKEPPAPHSCSQRRCLFLRRCESCRPGSLGKGRVKGMGHPSRHWWCLSRAGPWSCSLLVSLHPPTSSAGNAGAPGQQGAHGPAGPAPQTGELLPAMASRDPPGAIPLPPLHPVQGWGGLNPTAQPTPCSNQPQHGGTLTASDSHNGSSSGEGGVKAPQCTAGKGDICISQAVLAQGVNGPQSQGT